MTRLKHILIAGTLIPAMALIPLSLAAAQSPEQGEKHPKRQHEGAQKGEGHQPHGDRAGGAEHRREGGSRERAQKGDEPHGRERAQNRDEPHGGPGAKPRNNAADTPRATEPHGREKAQNREDRPSRREAGDTAGPGAGDHDRRGDHPGDQRKRAGERRGAPHDAADARGNDERKLGKGNRRDERHDDNRLGNQERRDERKLGNDERRDEKRLGNQERRDERKLGNDERRDDKRLGNQDRRDERRLGNDERRDERRGAPGPAVGFAGGFLPAGNARRIDDLRRDRREVREGDRTFIREPGRTIVQERGRSFIVHDENDRFRALGLDVRRERRGDQFVDTVRRPNGDVIITITDGSGRMLRRLRRDPGGREVVLIDNGVGGRIRPYAEDVVVLPPPPLRIPRDRYVVDYGAANAGLIYDTLIAPPLAPPPRRYTLDQIRYSPDIRSYVRQVDINTINFESGSWDVPHAADGKLEALASGMKRAIDRNPNSVFLVEGYTDATGNPNDNLSLSDRRAQSVAEILSKDFNVPPENLTTQGYGQQNLKEDTQGPSAANRRVVVQNITQLLASGGAPAGH